MSQLGDIRGRGASQFGIYGNGVDFAPFFLPDRFQVTKERNLVQHANFCGLEDVFEVHGHNREIHIAGKLRHSELEKFDRVIDHNQTAKLDTPAWSGEIRVRKGEYEGPVSWEPQTQQYLWEFSLDLISTGLSEPGHIRFYNDQRGVVSDGL